MQTTRCVSISRRRKEEKCYLKTYLIRRLYVRNFWSHEKRLPTATLERMLTVLSSLYSGQIERCFLSLATNLLLEMTSQSPDFKRDMFEYPLSECTFQDYVIDSNWRFRNTVMTPMFVETQSTQGPESLAPTQSGPAKGMVRATQMSLEFSQTQTEGTVFFPKTDVGTKPRARTHFPFSIPLRSPHGV